MGAKVKTAGTSGYSVSSAHSNKVDRSLSEGAYVRLNQRAIQPLRPNPLCCQKSEYLSMLASLKVIADTQAYLCISVVKLGIPRLDCTWRLSLLVFLADLGMMSKITSGESNSLLLPRPSDIPPLRLPKTHLSIRLRAALRICAIEARSLKAHGTLSMSITHVPSPMGLLEKLIFPSQSLLTATQPVG